MSASKYNIYVHAGMDMYKYGYVMDLYGYVYILLMGKF